MIERGSPMIFIENRPEIPSRQLALALVLSSRREGRRRCIPDPGFWKFQPGNTDIGSISGLPRTPPSLRSSLTFLKVDAEIKYAHLLRINHQTSHTHNMADAGIQIAALDNAGQLLQSVSAGLDKEKITIVSRVDEPGAY